jgi:hypothetical protein
MKEFPDEPGIHECRSRLFQQQGDLDAAYASLREEVARNPSRGNNPGVSMALGFGELYGSPDAQWKRFRRNLDPGEIELVRSLVAVHWPNTSRLEDRGFKEWIDGCCLLLKRVPDNPTMAVSAFGRVAETELRTRVFERFRAKMREETASVPGEETDPLSRYLRGRDRMTLEQMLNEIRYPEARSAAGRKFREWFGRERAAAWLQLLGLGDLNNRAKHPRPPFLDWKDAEKMARLTREFLDAILSM